MKTLYRILFFLSMALGVSAQTNAIGLRIGWRAATQAEVNAGTVSNVVVTPATLAASNVTLATTVSAFTGNGVLAAGNTNWYVGLPGGFYIQGGKTTNLVLTGQALVTQVVAYTTPFQNSVLDVVFTPQNLAPMLGNSDYAIYMTTTNLNQTNFTLSIWNTKAATARGIFNWQAVGH